MQPGMPPPPGYQQGPPPGAPQEPINSHMGWSIGAIFLFWPLAIPAIMAASRCNAAIAAGDYMGATAASEDAKKWAKLATIIGCCWIGLWCVIGVIWIIVVAAATSSAATY
ncbi:CD225/dispanin family protein [Actinocatenispora comari]|uniref:Interferon-induced transmembrane protein n=1 Tax=Actinocatenispora comari TaxID=2807577 RepID=A0A8J4AC06_9ACTN|nr:hypothetical protein NUM_28580 [Actinocatenispora comari]